ncbi:MAG: hypothetical protein JWR19_285 [Pedosphaera sp.]|nr:hypothetical protein [Pedosphaera sp.]
MSILAGASWLVAGSAYAENQPQGSLIELHSCEVYAGGCTVSSEAQQDSRYMLQVWDFTGGSWQGVELNGLKVAVLETTSTGNLADAGARPDHSVVYLPDSANAAQQAALLEWLKSRDAQLAASSIQTHVVPVAVTSSDSGVKVTAGQFVSLQTTAMGECKDRVCGEELWYEPSIKTSRFTVALNGGSQVNEPLLQLKWSDHGKRSVFVARFGESGLAKNTFVSSLEWCGPIKGLF